MTAAPHSPLLEKVAKEIRGILKPLPYPGDVEEAAQAALDACHADEMRQVLELLVYAKEMKERSGDTPAYRAKKEEGWKRARTILAKLDGQP